MKAFRSYLQQIGSERPSDANTQVLAPPRLLFSPIPPQVNATAGAQEQGSATPRSILGTTQSRQREPASSNFPARAPSTPSLREPLSELSDAHRIRPPFAPTASESLVPGEQRPAALSRMPLNSSPRPTPVPLPTQPAPTPSIGYPRNSLAGDAGFEAPQIPAGTAATPVHTVLSRRARVDSRSLEPRLDAQPALQKSQINPRQQPFAAVDAPAEPVPTATYIRPVPPNAPTPSSSAMATAGAPSPMRPKAADTQTADASQMRAKSARGARVDGGSLEPGLEPALQMPQIGPRQQPSTAEPPRDLRRPAATGQRQAENGVELSGVRIGSLQVTIVNQPVAVSVPASIEPPRERVSQNRLQGPLARGFGAFGLVQS
jgi:hypothetical protein